MSEWPDYSHLPDVWEIVETAEAVTRSVWGKDFVTDVRKWTNGNYVVQCAHNPDDPLYSGEILEEVGFAGNEEAGWYTAIYKGNSRDETLYQEPLPFGHAEVPNQQALIDAIDRLPSRYVGPLDARFEYWYG